MNLEQCRQKIKPQDIMNYISRKGNTLLLPDQDVLNALYGTKTHLIPDEIYNYDARYNIIYFTRSLGEWDLDWVIENTVFLHFVVKINLGEKTTRDAMQLCINIISIELKY